MSHLPSRQAICALIFAFVLNKNVPWHILAPSAVACDKLPHRASAHRWQVVPFCVLGSSNGIS